jgi:large subunit ribosomal protein L9
MRLILREEVENVGKRGDVVNVARGFARNFLLPKRLAMEVTDENLRLIEKEKKIYEAKLAKEKEDAEGLAAALSAVSLSFRRKAHGEEEEELYGSVSSADIAEGLEDKGFTIEKRKIQLDEPLKSIGTFTVAVKLHPEVSANIPVIIEKEEG